LWPAFAVAASAGAAYWWFSRFAFSSWRPELFNLEAAFKAPALGPWGTQAMEASVLAITAAPAEAEAALDAVADTAISTVETVIGAEAAQIEALGEAVGAQEPAATAEVKALTAPKKQKPRALRPVGVSSPAEPDKTLAALVEPMVAAPALVEPPASKTPEAVPAAPALAEAEAPSKRVRAKASSSTPPTVNAEVSEPLDAIEPPPAAKVKAKGGAAKARPLAPRSAQRRRARHLRRPEA